MPRSLHLLCFLSKSHLFIVTWLLQVEGSSTWSFPCLSKPFSDHQAFQSPQCAPSGSVVSHWLSYSAVSMNSKFIGSWDLFRERIHWLPQWVVVPMTLLGAAHLILLISMGVLLRAQRTGRCCQQRATNQFLDLMYVTILKFLSVCNKYFKSVLLISILKYLYLILRVWV